MYQGNYTIIKNEHLTREMMRVVLQGDTSSISAPGQFVNVSLDSFFLRRPFSVCDWDGRSLTLLYKIIGAGTASMEPLQPGSSLNVLCGLGNGFDTAIIGMSAPLLIGGGCGVAPLYALARILRSKGLPVTVILGFNTVSEVFYKNEFAALGADVIVTTVDGSDGIHGFVTDVMRDVKYDYFYSCGPMPMFRAVERTATTSGQYSFEERMGCGFGVCMGCSCLTRSGTKRVCKDGPVFRREEVIW